MNTVGSYACSCNRLENVFFDKKFIIDLEVLIPIFSGFMFFGDECVDVDECMQDRIDCGSNAQESPY